MQIKNKKNWVRGIKTKFEPGFLFLHKDASTLLIAAGFLGKAENNVLSSASLLFRDQ